MGDEIVKPREWESVREELLAAKLQNEGDWSEYRDKLNSEQNRKINKSLAALDPEEILYKCRFCQEPIRRKDQTGLFGREFVHRPCWNRGLLDWALRQFRGDNCDVNADTDPLDLILECYINSPFMWDRD